MDSTISILINRAENEIFLASAMKILSEEEKIRILMQVPPNMTFYSAAISHSYYSIFYSAKAILLTKGIITTSPDAHKKTFDQFKQNFVDTGILDVKLLAIYKRSSFEPMNSSEYSEKKNRKEETSHTKPYLRRIRNQPKTL